MSAVAEKDAVRVRMRPDLVVQTQVYEGQTQYVIKDPVAMRYFRFGPYEYFLLEHLDGKRSIEELKELFEVHFPDQRLEIEDIARFIGQLVQAGLVVVEAPGQGSVLYKRFKKQRFRKRLATWTNILYIKIPIIDPERLLTRMLPYFRWLYARPVVILTILCWFAAAFWVLGHYDEFRARLPTFHAFFNWRNIFYMWAILAVVKVIHEFGHGLTCKYFGGECHEMGLLFLVLAPCMYCDVSDSWLLKNKWHRVAIDAAGIYVELTLASLATFIWWVTPEGLVNTLALSVMFLCSVNTVLFNGNPLLRFDGYYILMDIMEVPNLRQKAQEFFLRLFAKVCLGLPAELDPLLPRSRRVFFVVYAIASYLYRWFIAIVILLFLYRFLQPYKLGVISAMLAAASLGTLVAMPFYQVGKYLMQARKVATISWWRLSATLLVATGLVSAFFFVPLPYSVRAMAHIQPAHPQQVWVEVPGILAELAVRNGDRVRRGDLIARLVNYDKQRELLQAEANLRQQELLAKALELHQDPAKRAEAVRARQQAQELRKLVENLRRELAMLELRADRDGVVIGAPKPEMLGAYFEQGTLFCQVGDPNQLEARLYVSQTHVSLVRVGQEVRIKLYSRADDTIEGTIAALSKVNTATLPTELSNKGGGEIPTTTDPATGREVPMETLYVAVVPLDPENLPPYVAPGQRGIAKIRVEPTTLAWRAWRLIRRTLGFAT